MHPSELAGGVCRTPRPRLPGCLSILASPAFFSCFSFFRSDAKNESFR